MFDGDQMRWYDHKILSDGGNCNVVIENMKKVFNFGIRDNQDLRHRFI